jgi:hypothetical protein
MTLLREKRAMADIVLGGEEFMTDVAPALDIEEEEDEDGGDTEATLSGVAASMKMLGISIETSSKDMMITVEEVINTLAQKAPTEDVYTLTAAGKNPKWVEETYQIRTPVRDIPQQLHNRGIHYTASDLALLTFVAQHQNNQAKYEDFLPLLDNENRALDLTRRQILGVDPSQPALFDVKVLNQTIQRLWDFVDTKKVKPGVLSIQGNTAMLGLASDQDRVQRGVLRFMQDRLAFREKKGDSDPNRFKGDELFNSLKTYGIIDSKFKMDGLREVMRALKEGKRYGDPSKQRDLVTIAKEKVVIRNGETQALRNALPGLLQHVRMAEMPELAKDLKQAMKDGNESKVVEIYRDLCDRVNEAQATGFRVPASVTTILNKVYEDLGSK